MVKRQKKKIRAKVDKILDHMLMGKGKEVNEEIRSKICDNVYDNIEAEYENIFGEDEKKMPFDTFCNLLLGNTIVVEAILRLLNTQVELKSLEGK